MTAEDLRAKWDEIKGAVKRRTQRKVLGMSTMAVGGIAVGVGALGLAFWLGRRSVKRGQEREPVKPGESFVGLERPQLQQRRPSRVAGMFEPALDTAVSTAVNAAMKTAVNALTRRLQQENRQHGQ